MSWGKGLDEILTTIDSAIFNLTYDPQGRRNIAPEGIDVILAWAGNDVYGEWGYLGFTWHNKQKWVKGFDELQCQAATWAPEQKAKVEEAIEKLKILANMPYVKSVTLVSGKSMGTAFALPNAYDNVMQSQAEALAEAGVVLVDPFPLHNLTDRYDTFHMEATAQNLSNTTRRYYALMSGILHDRQNWKASMEIAANSWKIISNLHFRKGNRQEDFNVPPITDLILPHDLVFGAEPPLARHPDEEIVIEAPILQHGVLHWEQLDPVNFDNEFMQNTAQEVTETDRIFLNPDLDAEVTITLEPTHTVQQTVTEILGDVDGRLSEDRALEKLNNEELEAIRFLEPEDPTTVDITEIFFTEPTAKSAPKPKSKPMPKRPPIPPRGRGTSRSPAASPGESVGRIDRRTLMEFGLARATSQTRATICLTRHWRRWGA